MKEEPNISPLVSVITPSYNHAKYIKETIESVVKQTYKNIEYFVIDDGSTDESPQIIKELSVKYDFYYEVQTNKGLALTYNKLISMCNGKYIAFIESDDVWTLDKIEKQVTFMENNPNVGVCGGNILKINGGNEILPNKFQNFQNYTRYFFKDIMSFNYCIFPLTVMIRKDIFDKVGLYDESLAFIDIYTWLKITENSYPIVFLPDLLGFYRIHDTNVHNNPLIMYNCEMKTFKDYKNHSLYKKTIKKRRIHYLPHLSVFHKREAIKIFFKCFSFNYVWFGSLVFLLMPKKVFSLIVKPIIKKYSEDYVYMFEEN